MIYTKTTTPADGNEKYGEQAYLKYKYGQDIIDEAIYDDTYDAAFGGYENALLDEDDDVMEKLMEGVVVDEKMIKKMLKEWKEFGEEENYTSREGFMDMVNPYNVRDVMWQTKHLLQKRIEFATNLPQSYVFKPDLKERKYRSKQQEIDYIKVINLYGLGLLQGLVDYMDERALDYLEENDNTDYWNVSYAHDRSIVMKATKKYAENLNNTYYFVIIKSNKNLVFIF